MSPSVTGRASQAGLFEEALVSHAAFRPYRSSASALRGRLRIGWLFHTAGLRSGAVCRSFLRSGRLRSCTRIRHARLSRRWGFLPQQRYLKVPLDAGPGDDRAGLHVQAHTELNANLVGLVRQASRFVQSGRSRRTHSAQRGLKGLGCVSDRLGLPRGADDTGSGAGVQQRRTFGSAAVVPGPEFRGVQGRRDYRGAAGGRHPPVGAAGYPLRPRLPGPQRPEALGPGDQGPGQGGPGTDWADRASRPPAAWTGTCGPAPVTPGPPGRNYSWEPAAGDP